MKVYNEKIRLDTYLAISTMVYSLYVYNIQKITDWHGPRYAIISQSNLKHFLSNHSYFYNELKDKLFDMIISNPWYEKYKNTEYMKTFSEPDFRDEFCSWFPDIFRIIQQYVPLKINFDLKNPIIFEDHEKDFPTALSTEYYEWIAKQTLLFLLIHDKSYDELKMIDNDHRTFNMNDDQLLYVMHQKALHAVIFATDDFMSNSDVIQMMMYLTSTVVNNGEITISENSKSGLITI